MHWPTALFPASELAGPERPGYRAGWSAACALLIALIAGFDYLTGYELNVSILYLAAVCLATWKLGRSAGVAFSLAAVGAWLVIDIMTAVHHYSHVFYRYWDTAFRLVIWVGFVLLLDQLKTALARADERFVTVLARLDAAVYVADSVSGELLYLNARCEQAFGPNPRNARDIDRRWRDRDRHAPPDAGRSQAEVCDELTGHWYLLSARTTRWLDGRAVGLYIATDITERKRAEELARQQQERLEQTSRLTTLGEMASTLAHEINQPLTAIAGYSRGCIRHLRSEDWRREELLEALEKCAAQAERAGGIIQRVREYLRKREPAPAPCDVNALIASVAGTVEAEAARRDARIVLAPDPAAPPVLADRIMIEQVLLNLIRNGLEAMQDTPAEARELTISTDREGQDRVSVAIADRGCGLPPPLRDQLFVPFFTTKAEGMGMGLHICRSLVERHGGRLAASPGAAGGTVLRFTLPAATS